MTIKETEDEVRNKDLKEKTVIKRYRVSNRARSRGNLVIVVVSLQSYLKKKSLP